MFNKSFSKLINWLDARYNITPIRNLIEHKKVPVHKYSFFYYLGGISLFLFIVQVITGILLLMALSLGFGFSGYLLPWNELAFFATKVGTDIAGALPLIGDTIKDVLRGGDDVNGATLSRFYGIHVAILPLLFTFLLVFHLFFIQKQGMHEPDSFKKLPEEKKKYT